MRYELTDGDASTLDPAQAAARAAQLQDLLATGRYPRFAAAVATQYGSGPSIDLGTQLRAPRRPGG